MIGYSRRWTRQPQGIARASDRFADRLSNLWLFNQGIASRADLVGSVHLVNIADPSRFDDGVTSAGVGLRGNGAAAGTAKGAYSAASISPVSGVYSSFTAFAIVTFESFAPTVSAPIFRATNGAAGSGVALELFPSTKTFRPAIATSGSTGWTTANDVADSTLALNTPWLVAMQHFGDSTPLTVYSNPLGQPLRLIKSATVTGSCLIYGPIYIGGMQSTASHAAFPGTIHCIGLSYHPESIPRFDKSDLDAVSQDWLQLFAPRRIWVPQSAGGGLPTLSASTYKPGTLTSSGWTPRITAI